MPRPQGARREQNYPTPEECVQLTIKVYKLTDPRLRDPVALHCRVWKANYGIVAQDGEWVESPALTLSRLDGQR